MKAIMMRWELSFGMGILLALGTFVPAAEAASVEEMAVREKLLRRNQVQEAREALVRQVRDSSDQRAIDRTVQNLAAALANQIGSEIRQAMEEERAAARKAERLAAKRREMLRSRLDFCREALGQMSDEELMDAFRAELDRRPELKAKVKKIVRGAQTAAKSSFPAPAAVHGPGARPALRGPEGRYVPDAPEWRHPNRPQPWRQGFRGGPRFPSPVVFPE